MNNEITSRLRGEDAEDDTQGHVMSAELTAEMIDAAMECGLTKEQAELIYREQ